MARNLPLWQQLAREGLQQYLERWMYVRLRQWKTQNAEPAWLDELPIDELDRFLPDAYNTRTSAEDVRLKDDAVAMIEAIVAEVATGKVRSRRGAGDSLGVYVGKRHLWWPLLYVGKAKPEVNILSTPVLLSRTEYDFVHRVESWLDKAPALPSACEVHLLRNEAKTGMRLFDKQGFYADFLLWIRQGECQTLVLVDPKGMRNLQSSAELFKVNLHRTLAEIEARIGDANLRLDAWLVSHTSEISAPAHLKPFSDHHIVHLGDDAAVAAWFGRLLRA